MTETGPCLKPVSTAASLGALLSETSRPGQTKEGRKAADCQPVTAPHLLGLSEYLEIHDLQPKFNRNICDI